MLRWSRTLIWGIAMKKFVLAATLVATASLATASAADLSCYSPADSEAEQALLFQTNLMVISSACRDTTYGEFRARNKDAIVRYQNAMIEHFRHTGARNPKSAFDTWQTSLANEIAQKQALTPTAQFCQQSAEMLKLASTLDQRAYHDYVASHVIDGSHPKCVK
jgi:hypothetical protein